MGNAFDNRAITGESYACQNCGAKLSYDATTQSLKCFYCGAQQAVAAAGIPNAQQVREISLEEGIRLAQRGYGAPVTTVGCGDCGATVTVNAGEQTAKCAFCASHQVLARDAAGTAIRPESLVPFRIDKAAANRTFEKWLGNLWFRPNGLKKLAKLEQMGGIYIPFWTFDATAHSRWRAEAGYFYYESEVDPNDTTRSRQVQRTRWEHASGSRRDSFDDLIVCASRGLPESLVNRVRTFDTKQLVPYQPHFLAGWRAEFYAVELMPAFQLAERQMESTQQGRCAGDCPGDTHRALEVQSSFSNVTFKHVLLPLWIAAYRYNGKPFQFLVNGQTGEVVGHAPYSVWKILVLIVILAAAVTAIVLIRSPPRASRGVLGSPAADLDRELRRPPPPARSSAAKH